MKWAMDDPRRFLQERAELDRLEAEVDWMTTAWHLADDGSINVDLDIEVHGRTYAGRMTYPDEFPDSPPYIRPRDTTERWSAHQYGAGGPLCLQWRADNWRRDVTGADMVRSAFELLSTEQHPELPNAVPSAHQATAGQSMRAEALRFFVTSDLLLTLLALPLSSKAALKSATVYNVGVAVTFVSDVADSEGTMRSMPDLPAGVSTSLPLFSLPREGWIFRSETFNHRASIQTFDELIKELAASGLVTHDTFVQEVAKCGPKVIVLLGSVLPSLRVFLIEPGEQSKPLEYKVMLPSSRDHRLPEEAERLSGVRIGIVGLGSIGSKMAISLARSGVRRFLLVDDDFLAEGNMVRHELSWMYMGVHKVNAVRDALALIAPSMQVDIRCMRVAGQEAATTAAATLKDLANCDLLVDATANPEVFLLLATTAKKHRKGLCWGEVFAGGYGGLIARARPGLDPNPLAVRDAIHAHLATLPPAPFRNARGYDLDQEQPLMAHDSDVGFVATSLTRLAIDTALKRDQSCFPYSVYMLGMDREWIFEAPFDTRPIEVTGDGWEPDVSTASNESRLAVLTTLLGMREEGSRADSDTAG